MPTEMDLLDKKTAKLCNIQWVAGNICVKNCVRAHYYPSGPGSPTWTFINSLLSILPPPLFFFVIFAFNQNLFSKMHLWNRDEWIHWNNYWAQHSSPCSDAALPCLRTGPNLFGQAFPGLRGREVRVSVNGLFLGGHLEAGCSSLECGGILCMVTCNVRKSRWRKVCMRVRTHAHAHTRSLQPAGQPARLVLDVLQALMLSRASSCSLLDN